MENWIRAQERLLDAAGTLPEFRDELRARFKFELIEDEQELSAASDDRVRQNFRALLRNLHLTREENCFPPQARYNVCLVLDAAAVEMLACLRFLDHPVQEFVAFREHTVRAIDANWVLSQATGAYCGVGQLSINALQRFYLLVASDANDRATEDLHPLNGFPH